jgi:hypothetical protein
MESSAKINLMNWNITEGVNTTEVGPAFVCVNDNGRLFRSVEPGDTLPTDR